MDITFSGQYKSISSFEWRQIPDLAVLTGRNGCGKTQVLELIAGHGPGARTKIDDEAGPVRRAMLVPSDVKDLANPAPVNIQQFQNSLAQYWDRYQGFVQRRDQPDWSIPEVEIARRTLERRGIDPPSFEVNDYFRIVGPHLMDAVRADVAQAHVRLFTHRLQYRFFAYYLGLLSDRERGIGDAELDSLHGPVPWKVVGNLLCAAKLPFRVWNPIENGLHTPYSLKLVDTRSDSKIAFSDLSSGERILVSLCLWTFHLKDTETDLSILFWTNLTHICILNSLNTY